MRIAFSPRFLLDLQEIADYIAVDNPARAFSFAQEIRDKCLSLSDAPESGVRRDDYGFGIRVVPFRRYVIFYIIYPDRLRIERILHSARHFPAMFDDR